MAEGAGTRESPRLPDPGVTASWGRDTGASFSELPIRPEVEMAFQ